MMSKTNKLILLSQTSSTNSYIKENIATLNHGDTVFTLNQKSGRGRFNRSWFGGEGDMLALSMLLDLKSVGFSIQETSLIPIITSVAVAKVFEDIIDDCCAYDVKVMIKWPNDILVEVDGVRGTFKKVCGILCEGILNSNEDSKIVIGIGINLSQPASFFSDFKIEHATSLEVAVGVKPDVNRLAYDVSRCVLKMIKQYRQDGAGGIIAQYERYNVLRGRNVAVISHTGERLSAGVVKGINVDGALLLQEESKEIVKIYAGDISIRSDGYNVGEFKYI